MIASAARSTALRASTVSERTTLINPSGWLSEIFGGRKTASGVKVDDQSTIGLSAIFDGIRLLAESEAQLPLKVLRKRPNGDTAAFTESPAFNLLYRRPNAYMDSFRMRKMMRKHAIFAGNAYAAIERNARFDPVALWPLEPKRVTPVLRGNDVVYLVDGSMELGPDHMIHLVGYSENGYLGIPLISLAFESLGHMIATERFGGRFFGNGANISGIIKSKRFLKDQEAVDRVKKSFISQTTGMDNAMSVALLEDDMSWERLGVAPEEAQFLGTKQFNITDVARWLNIPVPMLKEMGRATFSNLEQLDLQFVKYSLMPNLVSAEMEYEYKLLTTAQFNNPDYSIKHNVKGLLRGDTATQAEWYRTMFQTGAYSPNKILRTLDEETYDGGDTHFVHSGAEPVQSATMRPTT